MTEEVPNNSVLEVKLDYIQKDITAIKLDVREIKSDFISRREFNTSINDMESNFKVKIQSIDDKVNLINKIVYGIGGVAAVAVITAILNLIIKSHG